MAEKMMQNLRAKTEVTMLCEDNNLVTNTIGIKALDTTTYINCDQKAVIAPEGGKDKVEVMTCDNATVARMAASHKWQGE